MANKDNATCLICGKKYHLCITCERTRATWKPWKMIVDNENCYDIYQIINDYMFGKMSKDDAKAKLEKLNLSELNSFNDNVKTVINEIVDEKKVTKVKKTEEHNVANK